jgi:phosphoribosylaminoimidazole-succinocarboxamide synthase
VSTAHVPGFRHIHAGKVRDIYEVAADPTLLVMVASDRVSAFDWVLPTEIPDKGRVLTQMSLWWFERLADLVPNHVVVPGAPEGAPPEWHGRSIVCRRLAMFPVECVARGYLTGSGFADYKSTGQVCGVRLPGGLLEGSRLPRPIFTPSTKAPQGEHDANITMAEVTELVGAPVAGELADLTLEVYRRGAATAREAGILVADTKLEFGRDPATGATVLADEVLTPDSSRFWPVEAWHPGSAPPSYDKQFVRDWLTSPASGWDRASGEPPPPLPSKIVKKTRDRYAAVFERLTGRLLDTGSG